MALAAVSSVVRHGGSSAATRQSSNQGFAKIGYEVLSSVQGIGDKYPPMSRGAV